MHIAVNGRFQRQKITGVQRYAHQALEAIYERNADVSCTVLTPPGDSTLLARGWESFWLPYCAIRVKADCTLNLTNWAPIHNPLTAVVVLHDNLPSELPQLYSPRYRALRTVYMNRLRNSSSTVVTVSEKSRRSLEIELNRAVAVARPGVTVRRPEQGSAVVHDVYPLVALKGQPYVLFVGAHDPRKNLAFIEGLAPRLKALGLRVVATARKGIRTFRSEKLGNDAISLVEDPTDAELFELYSRASALLQPSLGEGFGLPLLEAASVGTPFVSSDTGDAANLAVDARQVVPLDVDSWVSSILWAVDNRSVIDRRMRERLEGYTWERCASILLEACRAATDVTK